MYFLNIETSSKNCSVSISKNENIISICEEISPQYSHDENLHNFIKWTLEGAEINLEDLSAISVGKGPGSFTGLRIGVSAAKGLAYGLEKPLISISSLYLLAFPFFYQKYDVIISVLDARRMEVYSAIYDINGNILLNDSAYIIDENSFLEYKDLSILIIGDCIEKIKEKIDLNKFQSITLTKKYPSARYMSKITHDRYIKEFFENTFLFEPYYLKDFYVK